MATKVTSLKGTTEIVMARRTEAMDAPYIQNLAVPFTEELFGRVNVINVIERAVLSITLVNEENEIFGHAAFFDYPNDPSVNPASWVEWMNKYYTADLSALNTLFLQYFVAKPEYENGCAKEIICTAFNTVPEIHFIFLAVPMGVFPSQALALLFFPEPRYKNATGPDTCAIFGCYRHDHVPVLHIRPAWVEDHDDLTPLFNQKTDVLQQTYGEFYLPELIEAQDEHMHCIVAEDKGIAIGLMSITDDVNLDILNQNFDLEVFHGLHEPDLSDDDKGKDKEHPEMRCDSSKSSLSASSQEKSENDQTSGEDLVESEAAMEDKLITEKDPKNKTPFTKEDEKSESLDKGSKTQKAEGIRTKEDGIESSDQLLSILLDKENKTSADAIKIIEGQDNSSSEIYMKPKLSDVHMRSYSGTQLSDEAGSLESIHKADVEIKIMHEDTLSRYPTIPLFPFKQPVPIYKGKPKAFAIQLFCINEKYEMRSVDFLPKAFSLFPDKDFCVITVPHLVPEFPLLQYFVRITPRCSSVLPHELYVFHKFGLIKDFAVRPSIKDDYNKIKKLVKTIDLHKKLLDDVHQYNAAKRDMDGTEIDCFVAESQSQVVGVAIIRGAEDIEYIRAHYNIEDFIYFNHHKRTEHAHLFHFALNPIFNYLTKHFLKEILRLSHKTCLYYPLYPPYVSEEVVGQHSLITALSQMVPVTARRQIVYPMELLGINAPSKRILEKKQAFALTHINCKLTLEPKVTINARIVVVGASSVGISFLETLSFCPHLRFNNLTLVSPHGLTDELPPDKLRNQMRAKHYCYDENDYSEMALHTWVNIVYGKMTKIDRKKKHVIVDGSAIVPFDYLILLTGQQYFIPTPTGADVDKPVVNTDEVLSNACKRFLGTPPKNIFLINDDFDAAVALQWIEDNVLNTSKAVAVYGYTIDAYCCVQTLLALQLPPSQIHFITPPKTYKLSCFNNTDVENAVIKVLEDCGVNVTHEHLLAKWNDGSDSEGDTLTSIAFTSCCKPLILDVCAMFIYCDKGIDYNTFKAVNDSCLVFDGKLVIDTGFHTNDISIRAAGPLTKFQRKYYADQWSHANFNSKEVGAALAAEMMHLCDPSFEPHHHINDDDVMNLIPMYQAPTIFGAVLPDNYHYLHIAKPTLPVPLEIHMAEPDYGQELITGTPGGQKNYFRLHINIYNTLETITCYSKQPFPATNFICLYGIHERLLNNLVSRFYEGLIDDFYTYFMESWCMAVYHDRFTDIKDEIREMLLNDNSNMPIEYKINQLMQEDADSPMHAKEKQLLSGFYNTSGMKKAVEIRLLSYLSYNYYHLPNYAKPGMITAPCQAKENTDSIDV